MGTYYLIPLSLGFLIQTWRMIPVSASEAAVQIEGDQLREGLKSETGTYEFDSC